MSISSIISLSNLRIPILDTKKEALDGTSHRRRCYFVIYIFEIFGLDYFTSTFNLVSYSILVLQIKFKFFNCVCPYLVAYAKNWKNWGINRINCYGGSTSGANNQANVLEDNVVAGSLMSGCRHNRGSIIGCLPRQDRFSVS